MLFWCIYYEIWKHSAKLSVKCLSDFMFNFENGFICRKKQGNCKKQSRSILVKYKIFMKSEKSENAFKNYWNKGESLKNI